MLPLPGAPSTSWAMYRARLRAAFAGADPRVCIAFWFFGLINNVLYVIILSAALDLVGPSVPKSAVLLFDVVPSFLTKLVAPYFIHLLPYPVRILLFASVSTAGMLLIALSPAYTGGSGTAAVKMLGVMLASLSSGAGELSFLGLTHYYGEFSLAAWGSGTGAAGLVGAGAYALATTVLGLGVKATLSASAVLPLGMVIAFFGVLPRGAMRERGMRGKSGSEAIHEDAEGEATVSPRTEDDIAVDDAEDEGLLGTGKRSALVSGTPTPWIHSLRTNIRRARGLFFPYMLPLLLVYTAEYTINQAVAPTLLFPLASSPFPSYRSFYPTYQFTYQAGVFLSRSSTPFLRIHALYAPSLLQCLNLLLLVLQSLYSPLPNVWCVLAVVFWEGLLGGLVYVNTFAQILEREPADAREFSLGAVTVSDSAGICVAGVLGIGVEGALCRWQVARGRDWCTRI
ncbi:G1/S-specific cyclin cln3 [Xylographa opegraphella]|nr:G1/S-specific cyclin cln3 [Xylographa opegraphella]